MTASTTATAVSAPAARAPGTELLGALTGSGYRDTPGLVRRGDGQTVQLTTVLYALLELVDGRRDESALAAALGTRIGRTVSAADVRFLLEDKLQPLGLLAAGDGTAPVVAKANPLLALRLKLVVSDPTATRRLTAPFLWLFRPAVVVGVLLAFAVTTWWVLVEKGLASATRSAFYEPELLLAVFALTVLSAGFHEFGHAAACRYAGATPGAMGAGLYLIWPAFYTDVDDSYRLGRRGRLCVDLGGLYFNAVVAVAVTAVWLVTRQDALLLGVATQLLQMVRQLAPFIRADGYHILADLTGVPDLFAHLRPTLRGLLPWRWGRGEPSPLKPWARIVVSLWVLIVGPVLLALLVLAVLLLPRLAATAWDGLHLQWAALTEALGGGDVAGVGARLLSIVALVLPVAAICYLLVRVVRRAAGAVWQASQGRPGRRAAVVLLALTIGAGVGAAWWPDGQYEPVRADERGTLGEVVDGGDAGRPDVTRASVTRPLGAVEPQAAVALVPRDGDRPVVLLTGAGSAARTILTDRSGATTATAGWAFPFDPPPSPAPGDSSAVAVNTTDGTVVYDVAYALVWIGDGARVENRNAAYALASCTRCASVAVAFQVVLIVGQSDVIAPVNSAVAANYDCVECLTVALARQLVLSLAQHPTDAVRAELEAAWSQLPQVTGDLDVDQLYDGIEAVQATIMEILVRHGLVADQVLVPTTAPTAAPTAATGVEPSPGSVAASETAPPTQGTPPPAAAEPTEPAAEPTTEPTPAEAAPSEEPAPTPTG